MVEENGEFFFSFFESHEKASVIRTLGSADQQKPLSISGEVGPGENVAVLHVGPGKARVTEPVPG